MIDGPRRTVAVVGGTGFIGSHLLARLRASGHRVIVLSRRDAMIDDVEVRQITSGAAVDPAVLAGVEVLVNLVGIKLARPGASWEQVHVELPQRLARAAHAAGVAHMLHVSVAGCEGATAEDGPYLHSKAEGERRLFALRDELEGLAISVVRPGVVWGRGDDMLRNLADSIRSAPVFPAPGGGRAPIAAVAVEDVAEAIVRCIERPSSWGRAFDIVGPALSLREIIGRVAQALGRRCVVVPAPVGLMRMAAGVLERLGDDPLITRAQLGLLARGVVGDPEPARRELDLLARELDADAIAAALEHVEPRLPSVRLVPDRAAERELAELAGAASSWRFVAFALVAVLALLIGPWVVTSIWLRMAALELGLSLLAIVALGMAWQPAWRPRVDALAWGLVAGVIMWGGAFMVAAVIDRVAPGVWSEATSLYAWARALPLERALPLLVVIVAGEEIVWRGALGLGLATRIGAWPAVLVSAALFTLAHLSSGPPLLAIAAALGGGAWTWLAIRTRSLAASFVAHLGWDVALLWLTPML